MQIFIQKRYTFLLILLFCCQALTAKKAKELIELDDLEKKEVKAVMLPSKEIAPKNVTTHFIPNVEQKMSLVPQETKTIITAKNETHEKKAAHHFIVPVIHKDEKIAQKLPEKKDDKAIQVTFFDDKKKEKAPRKIMINHGITQNMVTYHYLGAHVPTKLSICFNNQECITMSNKQLQTKNEPSFFLLEDDLVDVRCYYQFDVGGLVYRKGGKRIVYQIPKSVEKITTQFSWHQPEKVIIQEAKLIKMQDI